MDHSPGEALPSFPEPTHAKDPVKTGLTRFTSIKDAIGNIPPEWPDHDIPKDLPRPRKTSNENEPLPYIVTTHRSENTHPNGRRTPSLRELACLQGFSLKHLFPTQAKKKEIMNQIGNAFPPPPAAVLFESIKHQLLIRDKLMPQRLPKEGRQNV